MENLDLANDLDTPKFIGKHKRGTLNHAATTDPSREFLTKPIDTKKITFKIPGLHNSGSKA